MARHLPTTNNSEKYDTAIFLAANSAGVTQAFNHKGMEEATQTTCENLAPQCKIRLLRKILINMDHIAYTYATKTLHDTLPATPQDPATSRRFCRAPREEIKNAELRVEQEQTSFVSFISSYPLQHDAWLLIYTDGSSQEGPNGKLTGAAAYFAQKTEQS